jgi:hypothetical protein
MKLTHVKHIILKHCNKIANSNNQISYKSSFHGQISKNVCYVVNYQIILHRLKIDLLFVKS